MKKLVGLIIILFSFCVVNVSAETLSLKLISEENKVLNFDVVVTNVTGANNVFEGEVKYSKDDIATLKLLPVEGWEIYTRVKGNSIRFIALSMEKVAVENAPIFKVNTEVKNETKITLGNVATASGNVGISLDEVIYSYKEPVVESPKVEHIDTPKVEETDKEVVDEEVSVPDNDLMNNIEDVEDETSNKEEKKETRKDNQTSKTIVSILVAIAIVTLAFVFLFRKREGGVE